MSVLGVGTDLVEVARIEKALERHGDKLLHRVLSDSERERIPDRSNRAGYLANYLAKRFAIKEAVSKALGTGIAQGVSLHDIELFKSESGQPYVELSGAAKEHMLRLGGVSVQVSLSDDAGLVSAFAVLT